MARKKLRPSEGELVDLDADNIAGHHLCCALSGKKHLDGVNEKKAFLTRGFARGLTFRKLDARGKVFVEYAPAEAAFRPVHAPGFLVIHCLWVSGRFKGRGLAKALLQSCLDDLGTKNGVVAVAGKKIWLTNTEFFLHHGFEVVETTKSGFDLVCYQREPSVPAPRFQAAARAGVVPQTDGVHLQYVHQCPLVPHAVKEMSAAARDLGLQVSTEALDTPEKAQRAASPFGTFGAFLHGSFLTHGLMGRDSFRNLLEATLSKRD